MKKIQQLKEELTFKAEFINDAVKKITGGGLIKSWIATEYKEYEGTWYHEHSIYSAIPYACSGEELEQAISRGTSNGECGFLLKLTVLQEENTDVLQEGSLALIAMTTQKHEIINTITSKAEISAKEANIIVKHAREISNMLDDRKVVDVLVTPSLSNLGIKKTLMP